jgi:exodeoxyribonuclease-3
MNILSWNVNGIRAVEKKDFIPWLNNCGADIVCVQETKARPEQLSKELTEPQGASKIAGSRKHGAPYKTFWSSAKRAGYSGTAIFTRIEPDEVFRLGNAEFDDEGRVTACRFGKLAVISAYFPNSQEAGARLDYKLAFCAAILALCDSLVKRGIDIALCGDYNIAHKPIDLANPKTNEGNPGFLPEERAWMDTFTSNGYVDTFRHFCKEPGQYTWWAYRFHARERNVGWRIDYHCVNESLLPRVKSSTILADVQGSDHCPVSIEIDDEA